MSITLDAIDRRLLAVLQRDASRTAAQLAEEVGLSQAACWRRVQRLEKEGVIRARVALLDGVRIDRGTIILANVKLNAHGRAHLDEFIAEIQLLPEVLECFVLMGDQDFFLKVAVKDIYAYERFFFDHLSKIPGIAEVKSTMALSQIKNTTELPVQER